MTTKVVTLERPIGIWGTRFIADVEVSDCSVKLIKGYVKGFTGVNFSAGGQSLGFGISDWDFWLTEESIGNDSASRKEQESTTTVFKIYVSFRRIHFLIFNERQTLLVGEYSLREHSGVKTAATRQSQPGKQNKGKK